MKSEEATATDLKVKGTTQRWLGIGPQCWKMGGTTTACRPAVVPPSSLQTHSNLMPLACMEDQTCKEEGTDSPHSNNMLILINGEGTEEQVTHCGTESDNVNYTTDPAPHTSENVVVDVYTLDESGKLRRANMSSPF